MVTCPKYASDTSTSEANVWYLGVTGHRQGRGDGQFDTSLLLLPFTSRTYKLKFGMLVTEMIRV